MVKSRAVFPFDFVITVGDNIYTGNKPSDFEKAFAVPYKPLLDAGVLFYATLGNHDDTNQRFYKPFNMNGAELLHLQEGRTCASSRWTATTWIRSRLAWLETQLRQARQRRLEDLLLPSRAVFLREIPRARARPAEGARAPVRQVRRGCRLCRP